MENRTPGAVTLQLPWKNAADPWNRERPLTSRIRNAQKIASGHSTAGISCWPELDRMLVGAEKLGGEQKSTASSLGTRAYFDSEKAR